MYRADAAFANQFDRLLIMRAGSLLAPGLHDAVVLARGFDHSAALDNGQRERLFAINVLPGLTGHDRRQRVPVIGRGDDDRVDLLDLQEPPEIFVRRDLGLAGRRGPVQIRLINVADRDRRDVRILQKDRPGLHCPVAAADGADVYPVIRAQNAHSAQGRSGGGRNSGPGEISSA